jgi:signal transduction histidine kinase
VASKATRVLLELSRVLAGSGRVEALSLLASAAVEVIGAAGALVLEVQPSGELTAVASGGRSEGLSHWSGDADILGPELVSELGRAWDAPGGAVRVLPLVSGSRLFGALALFFSAERPSSARDLELAEGLVDLVATALDKSAQFDELRRAHEQLQASQDVLVRTEKLRALGEMAAGIAHDLKNLLNPLSLQLDVIDRAARRGDVSRVADMAREAKAVIRQGAETVERLRDFSRQSPERSVETGDLNRMAKEALALAKPRMASRSGVLNALREELGVVPPIAARSSEVVNALLNLIVNSIDAMPSGGTITVRTCTGERGGAQVEVIDDGPGMPEDVAAHAFDPFYTTKGDAGTGLGLAMVRSCMERHQGKVVLHSRLGEGTHVALWFPAAGSGTFAQSAEGSSQG